MKKSLLLFFLLCSLAQADFRINPAHVVDNKPPGYCVWTSLETLGRHHGIAPLSDVMTEVVRRGWPNAVASREASGYMQQLGAKCEIRQEGEQDWRLLENASLKQTGAVIGVTDWPSPGSYHAIILVHLDAEGGVFLDTNTGWRFTFVRRWLQERWTGFAIVPVLG